MSNWLFYWTLQWLTIFLKSNKFNFLFSNDLNQFFHSHIIIFWICREWFIISICHRKHDGFNFIYHIFIPSSLSFGKQWYGPTTSFQSIFNPRSLFRSSKIGSSKFCNRTSAAWINNFIFFTFKIVFSVPVDCAYWRPNSVKSSFADKPLFGPAIYSKKILLITCSESFMKFFFHCLYEYLSNFSVTQF